MDIGHYVLVALHQFSDCVSASKMGKLQWLINVRDCVKRLSGLFANRVLQQPSILSERLTSITKYVTPHTQTVGNRVHRINTEQN